MIRRLTSLPTCIARNTATALYLLNKRSIACELEGTPAAPPPARPAAPLPRKAAAQA